MGASKREFEEIRNEQQEQEEYELKTKTPCKE